jgi:TonB family protein
VPIATARCSWRCACVRFGLRGAAPFKVGHRKSRRPTQGLVAPGFCVFRFGHVAKRLSCLRRRVRRENTFGIMRHTLSFVVVLMVLLQSYPAAGQRAYDGPVQRRESNERCKSPEEPNCDHGFVRVTSPQPIRDQCVGPVFLPQGKQTAPIPPTLVQMLVDKSGNVAEAQIAQSSGNVVLDGALVSAAKRCKFTPGSRGGEPAALQTLWTYDWNRGAQAQAQAQAPAPVLILPSPVPHPRLTQVEHCPTPDYPPAALRAGAQGTTVVRLTVDSTGTVTESEIAKPSGESREHKLLDKAAHEALRKCKFSIAQGASERTTQISYTFSFTEEPAASAPHQ